MSRKRVAIGIGIAIFFQMCVLAGEYISASLPLWTGKEIKIKTIPVDPRSLFRGNYALLRYKISLIEKSKLSSDLDLRNGEKVYVKLKPAEKGLFEFEQAMLKPPTTGVFLRGRIENHEYEENVSYFRVKYGIEAFFAPKEKALLLEKELRNGGVAVLMVTDSGKAALKGILPDQN